MLYTIVYSIDVLLPAAVVIYKLHKAGKYKLSWRVMFRRFCTRFLLFFSYDSYVLLSLCLAALDGVEDILGLPNGFHHSVTSLISEL